MHAALDLTIGDLGDGGHSVHGSLWLVVGDGRDGSRSRSLGLMVGDGGNSSGSRSLGLVVRDGGDGSSAGLGLMIRDGADGSWASGSLRLTTTSTSVPGNHLLAAGTTYSEMVEMARFAFAVVWFIAAIPKVPG